MKEFEFQDISKYRSSLMGIATLMIIMCHAPASKVLMPSALGRILTVGNYGVDIFLFLSGLGCYYSLSKSPRYKDFVKKRGIRLFAPYLLITIPFIIFYLVMGEYNVKDALLSLTTFDYWVYHKGAWFVALLVPLYLISPLLYKLLTSRYKYLNLITMIVAIVVLCNINTEHCAYHDILRNIQFAFQRIPSFLIGMSIGALCKSQRTIGLGKLACCLLGWVILFVSSIYVFDEVFLGWLIVPLMIALLIGGLKLIPVLQSLLDKLGMISLESYLTNISINKLLRYLIPDYIDSPLFYGRYLEYTFVIVAGLLVAFLVNNFIKRKIQKVN